MSWRAVPYAVIVLALSWRLLASLAGVAIQLGSDDSYGRSLRERFAAIDESHAMRRRRSLGFVDEIIRAVEHHVPPQGTVAVFSPTQQRYSLPGRALLTTTWPRRIGPIEYFTDAEIEGGFVDGRPLFVLALDAEQRFPGQEHCVQLAGNRDFGLWRAEGADR